jgi:hypothetical protein
MVAFSPPATDRVPTDYVPVGPAGNDRYYPSPLPLRKLYGRYRGELRAPNIFKLVDGTYTTAQPYDNPPGSVIAYTYLGSHMYDVSVTEAAALTAAGFGSGVIAGVYGGAHYGNALYG